MTHSWALARVPPWTKPRFTWQAAHFAVATTWRRGDHRALVHGEVELHGLGGIDAVGRLGGAGQQRHGIAGFDGNRVGTRRGGRDLVGHGVGVDAVGARRGVAGSLRKRAFRSAPAP